MIFGAEKKLDDKLPNINFNSRAILGYVQCTKLKSILYIKFAEFLAELDDFYNRFMFNLVRTLFLTLCFKFNYFK